MPRHRVRDDSEIRELRDNPGMRKLIEALVGGMRTDGVDVGSFEARITRIVSEAFDKAQAPRKKTSKKNRKR